MSETVLVETHGDWLQITLNRPDKLNCLNEEMHLALRDALQRAHDQAARAVLITGAGRGFCAGQDLGDRRPGTADWPPDLQQTLNQKRDHPFKKRSPCKISTFYSGGGTCSIPYIRLVSHIQN